MEVKILCLDDSDTDCARTTYVAIHPETGKREILSSCALSSRETEIKARKLFGENVILRFEEDF